MTLPVRTNTQFFRNKTVEGTEKLCQRYSRMYGYGNVYLAACVNKEGKNAIVIAPANLAKFAQHIAGINGYAVYAD